MGVDRPVEPSDSVTCGSAPTLTAQVYEQLRAIAAQQAQRSAEANAAEARREAERAAAVGEFMRYVFALAQPETGPGASQPPVGDVLKLAAAQVDAKLRGQPEEQVVVRTLLAEAFQRLDMVDEFRARPRATARSACCRTTGSSPPARRSAGGY